MSNEQPQAKPLSQEEIEAFTAEWYRMLDEHVPANEITLMVADQGLEFVVPEATLRSRNEFGQWCVGGGSHPGVFNLFFDEVHTLRRVAVSGSVDNPTIEVVVNWQARRWRPPAPRSEWIGFDAYQRWKMIRSPETGRPVILRYIVDELRPMSGSKPL